MITRIVSALIALAFALPTLIYLGEEGTHILVFLVAIFGAGEYLKMVAPDEKKIWPIFHFVSFLFLFTLIYLDPSHFLPILGLLSLVLFSGALFLVPDTNKGFEVLSRLGAGLLYLPFQLSFLIKIREVDEELGLYWIFLVLLSTWSADSGAYFAGRAFGKNKLFPRVSPKKTWEGVFGGILLAMVVAVAFLHWFQPETKFYHGIAIGAILAIVSVVGDLVESLIKRSTGVKDSGSILPGHGGVLDRVDSILFTAPVTFLYLKYILEVV